MIRSDAAELALIREWVGKAKSAGAAAAPKATRPAAPAPIAITGVAGYFPGCEDVAAFWRHLDRDEALLAPIPADRFDAAAFPASAAVALPAGWGGFIPDIASFDPGLFGILPLEAEEMDPRQRLLLMAAWRTLEDAGLDPQALRKSNTGVFVAGEGNEYAVLMSRAGFTPKLGFGQANSMIANRISYAFDFAGPSEMIDATCAGFAVALHRAVVALRAGLIDRALVGAANLILLPDAFQFLAEAGQLTARSTVKSFGSDGDGFLRAEGVGTILIERREDAIAAGRRIYAEIKHTAVNFNGQGGVSMASPNPAAHAALIKACYREAGIDPRDLSYIEAQGMGSPVADIAEWAAFNRALQELGEERGVRLEPGFCRVSTLKPMLGHMHSASSLGALLKVIRSFQTGKIHKVLNFTAPNEYCEMRGTPCRLATETEAWAPADAPRLAAVHAYGSGGNNAHVLLEEPRENRRAAGDASAAAPRAFAAQRYWFQAGASATGPTPKATEVLQFIRSTLVQDAGRFDADAPFSTLGLDSLSVAPFVSRLESKFGVALRASDLFSHATPARLASYIGSLTQPAPWPKPTLPSTRNQPAGHDDIAIIGMSLQTAGAETTGDFWRLLREGRSAIGELPPGRRRGAGSPGPGAKGGFLSEIDAFDPLFFRISPKESATIDPRHRKLLQAAWAAIEDSGHSPDEWHGAGHGVFVGIEESDYPYNEQSAITAVHGGTAPARIGYFLDLKGPVLALSTACSSSLVAVHYACRSILAGESDCALAGGCNIICQPARTFEALARMGDMLSPDGTCYAFDRRANGMVLGEAVGLVVLKRLSQAVRDGDPIYAVIKGSGVNYDGRTNGLTAPSGARQRELYERVYRESGVEPAKIAYVVAHGTGTALGDPVECNALIDAFGARPGMKPWCALTSPKTNVGHTQAAAGIVNLITAALALKHGEIPPSLNFQDANTDINLATGPFYVNTALHPWTEPNRYAAVSSFGHTGTNAHVVLGNAPVTEVPATEPASSQAIVLSAGSEEQLRQAARNLLDGAVTSLADVAYTLQVGRQAMAERLGLSAATPEELREKLRGFLDGRTDVPGVFRGRVERDDASPAAADSSIPPGETAEVLKRWVNGATIDWRRWHGAKAPRRVQLPTYPFEKERFWLDVAAAVKPAAVGNASEIGSVTVAEADASMRVLTFAEAWIESPRTAAPGTDLRTIVCLVAGEDGDQAWREAFERVGPQRRWIFVPTSANLGAETFRELHRQHGTIDAVVWLHPLGDPAAIQDPSTVLPLLRALADAELAPGRLLLALPFANELERCHVDAWVAFEPSLARVLPGTKTAIIGLGQAAGQVLPPSSAAEVLWSEMTAVDFRSARHEGRRRFVRQVQPTRLSATGSAFKRGGTYLITGGRGSLGLACAEYLAKTYAANLVLVSRSAPDAETSTRLDALRRQAGEVIYAQADVCDPIALAAALTEAKKHVGPIIGVLHAAGVADARSILEKDAAALRRVLAPKVQGTLALDEALRHEPIDFVAYFSSSAGVLGDFGACDYAIGSRFEAAYAEYRNHLCARGERRGRTVVVQWPVWQQGAMGQAEGEATRFYLETSGQRALETAEGMAVLEQVLLAEPARHLVLVGKPERVQRFLGLATSPVAGAGERSSAAAGMAESNGGDLEDNVRSALVEIIGAQLNIERRKVRLGANLADFGFDSISLAEFAERLNAQFGLKITPAVFFGHSTIERLVRYFLAEHRPALERRYATALVTPTATATPSLARLAASPAAAPVGERTAAPALARDEPIAIIGMSGRFPQSRSIAEMWKILSEGRNAVEEIPVERFDWREFYGDSATDKKKSNGKWMGCLPGVAEFDPLFFDISPDEAETMDPRQRQLLQESWKALEDAGYGPRQLAQGKMGVFVGVEEGDYAFIAPEGGLTSNHNAILASRLAYFLDFRGPVMALNTACSSGLVAAHQACSSLRNGECDAALVASVSLQLTPAGHIAMGQSGMLSSDGKCHVFDQRANGLVPGEAVVALVLKRLSRAEADGDPIHAVIRASGVNYDGSTNGITAPNGVAQTELLASVYANARLDPASIEYVVTHGTGTKLGDPVEVNSLHAAFTRATTRRGYCALTSTKSNFGHTFAASGLVSAVSLVEAFRHEEIPASLHCEEQNTYIAWADSPFYVNRSRKAWPRQPGKTRLGAVSAFGMSGTNAHMVFEEYAGPARESPAAAPAYLLVLSAKTEAALREKAVDLSDALRTAEVRAAGLASVSHTLLVGRHPFAWRMAAVVRDVDDALLALEQLVAGETGRNFWRGRAPQDFQGQKAIRKHAETLVTMSRTQLQDREAYGETLCALGDLYCQGYDLPWHPLFGDPLPRRIALPTYPFARETYWAEKPRESSGAPAAARLHPLLHANTSTLREQRFSATFTGGEFWLADHRVHGERILPAVAYLEMVRAALEQSTPADERTGVVGLSHVVWLNPLTVGATPRALQLGLTAENERVVFAVETASRDGDNLTHATGKAAYLDVPAATTVDLAALRRRMNDGQIDGALTYAAFSAAGVDYGAAFRGLCEIHCGHDEVLAHLALPESVRASADPFGLHPSLMDSAFQATIGLERSSQVSSVPRIPFALEKLTQFAALPAEIWVWARPARGASVPGGGRSYDLDLVDATGRTLVEIRGLSTRPAPAGPGVDAEPEPAKVFPRIVTGTEFYVADHGGLLPGVVSLEWARAAGRLVSGRPVRGLKHVVWNRPLAARDANQEVQTELSRSGAGWNYRVTAGAIVHAQGQVTVEEPVDAVFPPLALDEIRARCASVLSPQEGEALIEARLGPAMRSLTAFQHHRTEALATLELPAGIRETADEFILHPSVLNGALQSCTLLAQLEHPADAPATPFGLDELRVLRPIPPDAYAHVKRIAEPGVGPNGSRLHTYDIVLADRNGEVAVVIRGYAAISAPRVTEGVVFAVPSWKEQPADGAARQNTAAPLFLLTDTAGGLGEAIGASWPQSRIVKLPKAAAAGEIEAQFRQVFETIQAGVLERPALDQAVLLVGSDSVDASVCVTCAALFRTARLEHPRLQAKAVRCMPALLASPDFLLPRLASELGQPGDDAEVRLAEAGQREVRSLREVILPHVATGGPERDGQVIWITGGLGGLGRAFARHYAVARKARVFLSGRSPLDAARQALLRELQADGADIRYLAGDVASVPDAEAMLRTILADAGRLDGVIHAAGVIDDAYLAAKTPDAVARVWRPKVAGALALDVATRDVDLAFMAFCSSLTGSFGNAGQADYAGANAFLDGFAEARNRQVAAGQRRGRTVSVAWPLWRDGGMRMDEQSEILLRQRSGMTPMPTPAGIDAWHRAYASEHDHVLVLHGEVENIRAKLFRATAERATPAPAAVPEAAARAVSAEPVHALLRRLVGEQQKLAPEKIELDVELPRYGFDSIRLTEFANRLNRTLGLDLMPTLFFEHTTLRAIARHLLEKHAAALASKTAAPVVAPLRGSGAPRVTRLRTHRERRDDAAAPAVHPAIAIVGMSGRFPGSPTVDAFWQHLEANHDLVTDVPEDRWNWRELFGDPSDEPGKTNVKSAGFMAGIDEFDPAFFGISPREAISMDPQFRLLLQTVWATIEDAGYRAGDLSGTKTGVFVGVSTSDYKDAWLRQPRDAAGDGPTLVSHFVVANRISYILNLHGPSEPIDTACSSSLIAIHRAIEAIRQGNCDQAIVGGVNVISAPDITIGASRAGMLSPDGRCKTFDEAADGYGRGEGVGALLLKPLDAAVRDGDHIYALVCGSAENHGGRAQSPTAPNPAAQKDLLVSAYSRAGIDPRTVGYIEAHGTGTGLGDPIEIEGLRGAFEALYQKAGLAVAGPHCGLGSVKTNIGHLEAAAGIAGIVKVVMMLRHRKIPGNVHLRVPNPYLRLEETPFYLVRDTQDWAAPRDEQGQPLPRRAGVSSFGIGGSNAHVILEEYAAPTPRDTADKAAAVPQAVVLSAKKAEGLEELARNLRDFLQAAPAGHCPSLREIAWTLQLGREALEERLALVATSVEQLIARLGDFLDGKAAGGGIYRGRARAGRAEAAPGVAPGANARLDPADYPRVLADWVNGAEVDWRGAWTEARPQRVSLPTYPFARNRYWFETGKNGHAKPSGHVNATASVNGRNGSKTPPAPGVAKEAIETFLVGTLAKILYVEDDAIERTGSFIDLGLDSVLAVEWIQSIKRQYGIKLPATKVYDHPTVAAMTEYLAQALAGRNDVATTPPADRPTLEEIFEQVRAQRLSVEQAEQMIDELGLDQAADE
jgi:polyketide synthase PksN